MCVILKQKDKFDFETIQFIKNNPKSYNGVKGTDLNVPKDNRYYQILHNNNLVGFIILDYQGDEKNNIVYELQIGIYNEFQRNHYATNALSLLVNVLISERKNFILEALIKDENEYKKYIIKLLICMGFTYFDGIFDYYINV